MAQHKTHKDTAEGKRATVARRASRERKYATRPLDLDALLIDTSNMDAARRAADLTTDHR